MSAPVVATETIEEAQESAEAPVATLEAVAEIAATKPARKPRKKKVAAAEEAATPAKAPECAVCHAVLDWQDYAYVGTSASECKNCHARAARAKLRGVFVKTMPVSARKQRPAARQGGDIYRLELRHWAAYRRVAAAR